MSHFIAAARAGDLDKVKAMLARDRSLLHARDENSNTAFHIAALLGHGHLVLFFIEEKCDGNEAGEFGRSVLMKAAECKRDNSNSIRALVKAGTMVNGKAHDDVGVLYLAAQLGAPQTLRTLVQCGAEVSIRRKGGWQPIHIAARFGSVEKVEILINAGASVNAESGNKITPIMKAAYGNKSDNIKLLHLFGGDVNPISMNGKTALHYACEKQHPESVSVLLALGARTDVKDDEGRIPLDVAQDYSNTHIVELIQKNAIPALHRFSVNEEVSRLNQLLRSGYDPNRVDWLGRTALHVAVINKNMSLLKFLLKYKANPDVQDEDWNVPIHLACITGFMPAVQALVEVADINVVGQNGLTAAMLASKWRKYEALELLLQKEEVELICQDSKGNTVLHHVAQSGDEKMMKLLLSVRPPPSLVSRNADNDSPLVVAARNHHAAIVRLILLELVPESNIERSLTTFTRSTRGLDASVTILPTNFAIEVINKMHGDDLIQYVLDFKDTFDL